MFFPFSRCKYTSFSRTIVCFWAKNRHSAKPLYVMLSKEKLENVTKTMNQVELKQLMRVVLETAIDNYLDEREEAPGAGHQLVATYESWLQDYRQQVNAGLKAESTLRKHLSVLKHLRLFIQHAYHQDDLYINKVDDNFLTTFQAYLKNDCQLAVNTIWIYLMLVIRLLKKAYQKGWVDHDLSAEFCNKNEECDRGYLTAEELRNFRNCHLENDKERLVRDLFVFCCYTGLAHADLQQLTMASLVTSPTDGSEWIRVRRQKTHVYETVKLLPVAREILSCYSLVDLDNMPEDAKGPQRLLPVPSLGICNRTLQKIIAICGIQKRVTWHIARHTMATTICLSHDIPMPVVSQILGHKSLKSTQIYAKVTHDHLSHELDRLERELGDD